MRAVNKTGAALPSEATRRDLLLEILALRHQLCVLARSHRRFRPTDRLLWLLLRRWWPRWREALVFVQPATVDRWYREGVRRCWRPRTRRPGRPPIDSEHRGLIRRLAAENCLWGAPRIHGELLKLGVTVSERTVSRYLRDRPRSPSQTWPTFLANHVGQFVSSSPLASSYALDDENDLDQVPRQPLLPGDWPYVYQAAVVDPRASLRWTPFGTHLVEDRLRDRITIRDGRGPPAMNGCRHPMFVGRGDLSVSIGRQRRPTLPDLACHDPLTSSTPSGNVFASRCRSAR
jgi:hypothetical protein